MKVRRGELVPFPFASRDGVKRRPALVVQCDADNSRLANTILAAITSTTHRSDRRTQLLVDPATPMGQGSGLLVCSVVSCENLITIERKLIARQLGRLDSSAMLEVNECLKAALGLNESASGPESR